MFNDKNNKKLSSSKIDTMPITNVLGVDVMLIGEIKGDSVIRIDGKVEGNILLKQGVVLGEKAQLKGDINSDFVVIYGSATGNITCKELIIRKSGVVNGDIDTEIIEIEMGGKYNGKLTMKEATVGAEKSK